MTKIGISIEPAEVWLITSSDDPYTWQILPEKQHLFKKQLSKHSIGAYRELYRAVGVSFEAILAPESNIAAQRKPPEKTQGERVCVFSVDKFITDGTNSMLLAPKSASLQ